MQNRHVVTSRSCTGSGVNRLDPFDTEGTPVLGLSSNGLLSIISLVTAAVLVAAAVRGGRTVSTVTFGVGAAFLLSGVLNVLVLGGPYNILAFRISNVTFSLLAGAILMIMGAYGRFVGWLPDDNLYQRERHDDDAPAPLPTTHTTPEDIAAATEMAAAERAVAQHSATPEQAERVRTVGRLRSGEDRVEGWRASS